jgi:hypothetical protein
MTSLCGEASDGIIRGPETTELPSPKDRPLFFNWFRWTLRRGPAVPKACNESDTHGTACRGVKGDMPRRTKHLAQAGTPEMLSQVMRLGWALHGTGFDFIKTVAHPVSMVLRSTGGTTPRRHLPTLVDLHTSVGTSLFPSKSTPLGFLPSGLLSASNAIGRAADLPVLL